MNINTTNEGDVPHQLFSYHVFLFAFKWEIKERENLSFSERTSIKDLKIPNNSSWKIVASPTMDYERELYNEKNFFYGFTHTALYNNDTTNTIIHHYERKETSEQNVVYKIHVVADKESLYELKVKSICLNIYETGVGVLMFYLENDLYKEWDDILRINQYGRRT